MQQNKLPNIEPDTSCAFENVPIKLLFILTGQWKVDGWLTTYSFLQGMQATYTAFNNVPLDDPFYGEIDFLMRILLTEFY